MIASLELDDGISRETAGSRMVNHMSDGGQPAVTYGLGAAGRCGITGSAASSPRGSNVSALREARSRPAWKGDGQEARQDLAHRDVQWGHLHIDGSASEAAGPASRG